jgi:hypothetical protein
MMEGADFEGCAKKTFSERAKEQTIWNLRIGSQRPVHEGRASLREHYASSEMLSLPGSLTLKAYLCVECTLRGTFSNMYRKGLNWHFPSRVKMCVSNYRTGFTLGPLDIISIPILY